MLVAARMRGGQVNIFAYLLHPAHPTAPFAAYWRTRARSRACFGLRKMRKETAPVLENLLVDMASGNEASLRRLYDVQADWVFAIALRILRDRQAAEDAVQETFVKLWRTASRFDAKLGSAKSWIGIIARNAALDLGRRRQPVSEWDDEAAASMAVDPVEPPDPKLGKCLERLPADQAHAIVTMYSYGLSHSELSEQLALPLGTVKSWIRRGTQSLKICMEE